MRLTKIKLAGFKSFVDPTVLHLSGNLSAVVGPNGCGKSNVIDAVRWVMGESSAKNLRGGAITDVIFNGSTGRKPVGQASVELLFDNSDGRLGGQYASYAEIAIKRIVTRDGQSKYYLNGQGCRRRDIKDVFLGTGLGPRSYAIIEQGMISRVIDAKPDDLRIFLEEAAGISKYKERRRETENRIKHTQENLDRLNDLRDELDKQMRHLERQSEAAKKYNEYKSELSTTEQQLAAMTYQRLNTDIQNLEQKIREASVALESQLAKVQHIKTAQEKAQIDQQQAHEVLNEAQKVYYGIGADIAKIEQSLQHHTERKASWLADKQDAEQSLAEAKQQSHLDQTRSEELKSALQQLQQDNQIAIDEANCSNKAENTAETALEDWRENHQALQQAAVKPGQQAESEKAKIAQLERQVQQTQTRHEKLITQQNSLVKVDNSDLDNFEDGIQAIQTDIASIETQLAAALEERKQVSEKMQALKPEMQSAQQALDANKGELSALQAFQANALGKNNEARTQWLVQQSLNDVPYCAEKLQVTTGWESAVEAVLGDWLQALGLNEAALKQVSSKLGDLSGEGLKMLAWNDSPTHLSKTPQRLTSVLQGSEHLPLSVFKHLEQVHLAEDLTQAQTLLSQLSDTESVITKTGIWLHRDWIMVKGSQDAADDSLMRREQAIKDLCQTIETQAEALESQQMALRDLEKHFQDCDDKKETLQQALHDKKSALTELTSERNVKRNQWEQYQARDAQIRQELQECVDTLNQVQAEIQQARQQLATLVEDMSAKHEALAASQDKKAALQESLQAARQKARADREKMHGLAMSIQTHQTQLEALNHNQTRLEQHIGQLSQKITHLDSQLERADEPVAELKESLESALAKRLESEQALNVARDQVAACDNQLSDLGRQLNVESQAVESVREKGESLKLNCQSFIVRRETVLEQLQSDPNSIDQIVANLPAEADEATWQSQIESLSAKIQRLGAINLAAIEEFETAKERKVYLDEQLADLTEALTTLENAIKKIDKETRAKFEETFNNVNNHFKVLFPQLFGGGQAHLEMTGDDLLDTGVTVMARPPGKKNSSIQLLSGGEKALTAISLVFSIFQLNPAPFCLLDEVDAPLDDSNVGRFCRLVQEMAQSVQFIFISHNKVAIEMAEQLHGVTMREPGVSRLVTVDIEEAKSLAQA